jgi:hypothetical protein
MAVALLSSLVLRERDATNVLGRAPGARGRWHLRPSPSSTGHCPRFPFDYVNEATGEIRPASCKSIRCEVCAPFEVRRRAWRIAAARPRRFLTLTKLPREYQAARRAEYLFLRMIRRDGYRIDWAIAHELTKRDDRHAHAVTKGDFIEQRLLSQYAERAGMGRVVWVSRIKDAGATRYALKESLRVVGYATKGGTEGLEQHLDLNGGRLCRTTRGYFRS